MNGRKAGVIGNAVSLAVGRTIVVLYGPMSVGQMASLATALGPSTGG